MQEVQEVAATYEELNDNCQQQEAISKWLAGVKILDEPKRKKKMCLPCSGGLGKRSDKEPDCSDTHRKREEKCE